MAVTRPFGVYPPLSVLYDTLSSYVSMPTLTTPNGSAPPTKMSLLRRKVSKRLCQFTARFLVWTVFDTVCLGALRLTRLQKRAQEWGPQSQLVDLHIARSQFERIPIQRGGGEGTIMQPVLRLSTSCRGECKQTLQMRSRTTRKLSISSMSIKQTPALYCISVTQQLALRIELLRSVPLSPASQGAMLVCATRPITLQTASKLSLTFRSA